MPKPGRYHIARKIADGGMAEIFLGTQHGMEGFERPVVLKRILAALVADPQFRNMLIDEAHVAMGLGHSNIVQVLDLGHVRGRYFLVLELVDGWDLSQILARATAANFAIPPEIQLYIAAEVCRALAYAHARTRDGQPLAIVHRDVSPQNVLLSEQGEVKLTDFGIAKAMGRRERTNQGVIKGKLAFMSPEQASGSILDNRSDLFSLGTILYLFFTGRRPFEAPTDLESIMLVRECRFAAPEEVKPSLDPAMAKIIRRALERLPSRRYQNADEMLVDIENVQRTVYRPAGQTELKRWLADLQTRDHCPTISRAAAKPLSSEYEELDVGEGAEVVFDESELVDINDIVYGIQPTIAASAEELSGIRAKAPEKAPDRPKDKTTAATPTSIKQSKIPTRIIVFAAAIVTAALAAWGLLPDSPRGHDRHKAEARSRQQGTPSAAEPKPAAPQPATAKPVEVPPEPPPLPALPTAGALVATKPSLDSGVADRAVEAGHLTTAPNEAEEDEENLLKHAEPDDAERVIGEDEGVVTAGHRAKVDKAATVEPVSVHVVSVPDGAVISIGKRVFGRAPMNLRFRPGVLFELTFVKKGYHPTTRRIAVANRKNQGVKVVLKKKASAPKKSLFRRIFGR
jgi:serine/threonine protein kinase